MDRELSTPSARCWAEIDRPALRHNLAVVREAIGPGPKIISVVKANAYGHGIDAVIDALEAGSDLFAVANLVEACEVRATGCKKPVILLGPPLPWEYAAIAKAGFIPTLSSVGEAREYAAHHPESEKPIHFAVDSGMGRIGSWIENALGEIDTIVKIGGLLIQSVSIHLPSADEDGEFTKTQLEEFTAFADKVRAGHPGIAFHALNSAGIQTFASFALDMVRPGLMLYGASSLPEFQSRLHPALQWRTRVTLMRDLPAGRSVSYGRTYVTRSPILAATLPVGYADGYPRQLSGRGASVLINGKRCPLLGRVTMDQIVVDATGTAATAGSIATLIGCDGTERIRAEELADLAGTIPWHIFTGLGNRVQHVDPPGSHGV